MGVEKPKSRLSAIVTRACRLPRKVAGRVSDLSDSISKEHLKLIQSQNNFPYKYVTVAILFLLYLPLMLSFTYVIPPQVELTLGSEVDTVQHCDIIPISEEGVTHALLLNNTPFSLTDDWELGWGLRWMEYDINRYGHNESDGYHFTSSTLEYSNIVLTRVMQIPLFNYSDVTVSVEIEGISGGAATYLEVFVDDARAVSEAVIVPNQIHQVNVSAPLEEARLESSSWLGTVVCRLQIGFSEGAHVILRGIVIGAEFTGKMSRVQFDIESTENVSLYENPSMKYLEYSPQIMIVQNNDSSSVGKYSPCRVDDEIYLPPGIYEGVTYWDFGDSDSSEPSNSSLWGPDVSFIVSEDTALEINVRLFVLKLDIDVSPSVLLKSMLIYINDDYRYTHSTDIIGSTVYSDIPDYFYIPGNIDSLTVSIWFWTSFSPRRGWGFPSTPNFQIIKEATFGMNNNSMNLQLGVHLPYAPIGGFLLGLGESIILISIGFLIIGFIISLRRVLRNSDLRNRLSDSRILPLLMLSAGVFLPWSMQLSTAASSSYDGVYWISWFSIPFMIRWSDSTAIQLLVAVPDWLYASLISTFLLFIPLFYGYLSLSSPETENFDKAFALALFLPILIVLANVNHIPISVATIAIGPIVVIAALPVWLLRLALRKLRITT